MTLRASSGFWRTRVWRGFASLGICLVAAATHGDALDEWTTHNFPSVPRPGCSPSGNTGTGDYAPALWRTAFYRGAFHATGTGMCAQDTPTVILRSTDGLQWKQSVTPSWNGFHSVVSSPDAIVGVSWGMQVVFSNDGQTWEMASHPFFIDFSNWRDVTYSSNRYVAVGEGPRLITSSNGAVWVAGNYTFSVAPTNGYVTVAGGNGVFWAATPYQLYRSTDGITFRRRTPAEAVAVGDRFIRFGNNRFVRAADSLLVCTNGINWVPAPAPPAYPFQTLTFAAGMFLATADRHVLTSVDGFNWHMRTNALPGPTLDVAYGNGMFLATASWTGNYPTNSYPTNYYRSGFVGALTPAATPGQVWLQGLTNRSYDISSVSTLTTGSWPVLARVTLTNSPQAWLDTNAVSHHRRFYRATLVP